MQVIKPPALLPHVESGATVFLAGSIEMGKAEDWQTMVSNVLTGFKGYVYNPRRDDWDASWKQSINNVQFREQVEWELRALERSDLIFMYFQPGTQSPISLLEYGLYVKSNKLVVCCPEGFWRRGNIEVTSVMYGVTVHDALPEAVSALCNRLRELNK
jgi:hypothetical protein